MEFVSGALEELLYYPRKPKRLKRELQKGKKMSNGHENSLLCLYARSLFGVHCRTLRIEDEMLTEKKHISTLL